MFNKILVPVDLSTDEMTKKLCITANDMAEKYNSEIRLITVLPGFGMPLVASYFPEDAQKKIKAEMMEKLEQLAKKHFTGKISLHLDQGKRVKEILKEIESYQPDLVIIGCRPKKSRNNQRLLGSFGAGVSDQANCSVMIVR